MNDDHPIVVKVHVKAPGKKQPYSFRHSVTQAFLEQHDIETVKDLLVEAFSNKLDLVFDGKKPTPKLAIVRNKDGKSCS